MTVTIDRCITSMSMMVNWHELPFCFKPTATFVKLGSFAWLCHMWANHGQYQLVDSHNSINSKCCSHCSLTCSIQLFTRICSSGMVVQPKLWKKWRRQFVWLSGSSKRAKCTSCRDWSCEVLQRWQLVQHENSKLHQSKGFNCPNVKEFEKMLAERADGTSLRKSSAGPFQTAKMLWCCNEAVKDHIKKMMKTAITASVSQDGQGAAVGIRMCVVGPGRAFASLSGLVSSTLTIDIHLKVHQLEVK